MTEQIPAIVLAAQSKTILEAAHAYHKLGFSLLPLHGKRPSVKEWTQFQHTAADLPTIHVWHQAGLLQNIGIVCGAVSDNLVVLDLDGAAGYPAFAAIFPHLAATYTVATGGGIGKHIYWKVDQLPPAIKAMGTPIGNLEMCADGRQVVAPPSLHPKTGRPYTIYKEDDILKVADLAEVVAWLESFKGKPATQSWQPPRLSLSSIGNLNPKVMDALARHFARHGYKAYGDWLHGPCIYPQNHRHGDKNPSFGYNTQTGYGHCHVCGTMLAKDICAAVGIRPENYGGLIEKHYDIPQATSSIRLSDVPMDKSPTKNYADDTNPPKDDLPPISELELPKWLQMYLDWAGKTGNQTPMSFHLAAGLWLLSIAIGRRLYGAAPWGINLYPNLYIMLVASTTYYRKSTAYKLAEKVAREAIPHMLMPTPGSPERFQESLSGKMPTNFDSLTDEQQNRLTKAKPFAAQRGLLKDEIAGLFGAINRKDYMLGLKDLVMELYDCPEYSDKDTQGGLTVVERAALSILGVTTPAGIGAATTHVDWSNGLLVRFALITPENDYEERPSLKDQLPLPQPLVEGLKRLHERLPMPTEDGDKVLPPGELRATVECWEDCQQYSEYLRQLCKPDQDAELDERLKGVYGRMHVQAFKLAMLLAALDWLDSDQPTPTVTTSHWNTAQQITEHWRRSAHRLLEQIDRSGEARREQSIQDRMLDAFRQGGATGCKLRDVYRQLHLPAKQARQMANDLVLAGLLSETLIDGAEGYIARPSRENGHR
ncbi:MAG: bifunctional DNA primase/polymerase [Anaerolineae bacterium]|nr:bifunctional DNA primase/polymerase [Anaerolineae bacterium]